MQIASGELLASERVEEGEEVCEDRVEVDGDFTMSRSSAYVLPLPPLKHADICGGY